MAAYKNKHPKQVSIPSFGPTRAVEPNPRITNREDPDSIMHQYPSWGFLYCDTGDDSNWSFVQSRLESEFWSHIFPKLQAYEQMTWADIMINSKKQNHSNQVSDMNKVARDRLIELEIEAESLFSLHINGKCRLYGYLDGSIYRIVWYDNDHGDNETCVFRSRLKHT